jgi:hypothetical protein
LGRTTIHGSEDVHTGALEATLSLAQTFCTIEKAWRKSGPISFWHFEQLEVEHAQIFHNKELSML